MKILSSNHRKYLTRNPLKQLLIDKFMNAILNSIAEKEPGSLLEIGCGEGFMTSLIHERFPDIRHVAMDLSEEAVDIARSKASKVSFHCSNVENLEFDDNSFDLVLCAEVLEHLPTVKKAMPEICRVSKGDIILSVPNEPFFQIANFLALNHLKTLGNPPDHLRHWTKNGFVELIRSYVDISKVYSPFPWTLVVGRKKVVW